MKNYASSSGYHCHKMHENLVQKLYIKVNGGVMAGSS